MLLGVADIKITVQKKLVLLFENWTKVIVIRSVY